MSLDAPSVFCAMFLPSTLHLFPSVKVGGYEVDNTVRFTSFTAVDCHYTMTRISQSIVHLRTSNDKAMPC